MNDDLGPEAPEPILLPAVPPADEQLIVKGPRRSPAAYAAVALGLVGLIGGAVFFVRKVSPATGGAATPAAAVQRLFDAIETEDALAVLEALLPSERDTFRRSLEDITRELGRLEILSGNLDLGDIPGLDLELSELRFSEEPVASGITNVLLVGGTVDYRIDPARSPLGDFVRDLMPEEANEVISGSDTIAGGDDSFFTTVREGDLWYVSIWYSVAEAARRGSSAPVPPFGKGVAARGAGTPEQAVEQMLRAAVALDVTRLIELTPPVEARALHDYAPLFLEDAVAAADEVRGSFEVDIRTLDLSSRQQGDRAVVTVDALSFSLRVPDLGLGIDYDGKCVTIEGDLFGGFIPKRQCGPGLGSRSPLPVLPTPDVGVVTVREGGQWYVSPTGTILDGIVETLRALKRSDLDEIKRFFTSFMFGPGIQQSAPKWSG